MLENIEKLAELGKCQGKKSCLERQFFLLILYIPTALSSSVPMVHFYGAFRCIILPLMLYFVIILIVFVSRVTLTWMRVLHTFG